MVNILDKSNFDVEDFGEEIVLVHFKTGIYYTIKGSGPAILRAFQTALELDVLYKTVLDLFGAERLKDVELFIAQLLDEGIIISTDAAATEPELASLALPEALVIEKFDDVSDLIKLDPIHDVSDLGWPHKK